MRLCASRRNLQYYTFLYRFFKNFSVRQRNYDAKGDKSDPNEDEVAPSDRLDCARKCYIGKRGGGIAEKIEESSCRRNKSRVAQTGAITAPEHRCRRVRGHDGKHDEDYVENGNLDEIREREEDDRRGEDDEDRLIHIVAEAFIEEDGDKGGHRNGKSCAREYACRIGRGEAEILRDIGGQPEDDRSADNARENRDEREFDYLTLKKDLQIARALLFRLILTVFYESLFLKDRKASKNACRHRYKHARADEEHALPREKHRKDTRRGRAEERGKGISKRATGGVDRLGVFRNHLRHRAVDHRKEESGQTVYDHCRIRLFDDDGQEQIRHARKEKPHCEHILCLDLVAYRAVYELTEGVKKEIERRNASYILLGKAVRNHLRRDGRKDVSCYVNGEIRHRAKRTEIDRVFRVFGNFHYLVNTFVAIL